MFNFQNGFAFPYLILLAVGMMVPSDGNHGLFSIKSVAFLGSVISLSYLAWLKGSLNRYQIKQLYFLSAAIIFLLIWSAVAILEGSTKTESIYDQFKLWLLTICVIFMTLYVEEEQLLTYRTFVKTIIYAHFSYMCAKLMIIALYFLGVIDLDSFLTKMGFRYMTMDIYGNMARLQTSVDITTPFLLYFVLQSKSLKINFNTFFKSLFLIISVFSIFFSFSRFLMAIAALACFLSWINLDWFKKMSWQIATCMIVMLSLSWMGTTKVESIIEKRFFSRSAWASDQTREIQMHALLKEFQEHPLMGKGIGSYSERVIRDKKNYHSYEVQWIAFLMQLGTIGIILLSVPLIGIARQFLYYPLDAQNLSLFILFMSWLSAGFFNPFLISLASGIVYALFIWTAFQIRQAHK